MDDKDEHSKDDPDKRPSIGQQILSAAANEVGFAVDSIRQEVVEKGWFGERVTPEHMKIEASPEIGQDSSNRDKEFSWDDLYGQEPDRSEQALEHEQVLDQDLER
jgi:hypothetical protein